MLFGSRGRKAYAQGAPRLIQTFRRDVHESVGRVVDADVALLMMAYTHFALAIWGQRGDVVEEDTDAILTTAAISIQRDAGQHDLDQPYLYRTTQFFRRAIVAAQGAPGPFAAEFHRLVADRVTMPAQAFVDALGRECHRLTYESAAA